MKTNSLWKLNGKKECLYFVTNVTTADFIRWAVISFTCPLFKQPFHLLVLSLYSNDYEGHIYSLQLPWSRRLQITTGAEFLFIIPSSHLPVWSTLHLQLLVWLLDPRLCPPPGTVLCCQPWRAKHSTSPLIIQLKTSEKSIKSHNTPCIILRGRSLWFPWWSSWRRSPDH